ncbi:hypothetical protein GCM10023196_037520 [Actinoallomurus vinaceus]|uniref:ATP-binding protein n=1 Tax=Actinoallomurus vinaceus TaxID=1080074 RepID=A0ABP8UD22_9ACTN
MATLHVMRGLPGSGKTQAAKEWVAQNPEHRARINRDDLRQMMHDGRYIPKVTEPQIVAVRNISIITMLRKGFDVISDDSNITHVGLRDLARIAFRSGVGWEVHDFTHVPVEECLRRDAERERPVGAPIIWKLYHQLQNAPDGPLPSPADFAQADRHPEQDRGLSVPSPTT